MLYRAEFAGVREDVWSTNALTFDTAEEAEQYADALLMRWTGADAARVVPDVTPKHERVDDHDPQIVAWLR